MCVLYRPVGSYFFFFMLITVYTVDNLFNLYPEKINHYVVSTWLFSFFHFNCFSASFFFVKAFCIVKRKKYNEIKIEILFLISSIIYIFIKQKKEEGLYFWFCLTFVSVRCYCYLLLNFN